MIVIKSTMTAGTCTVLSISALLLIASAAHAGTPPTTSSGARGLLRGQIICDQLLPLETVVVTAKYVHFRPKYASRTVERQGEDLPSEFLVDKHGRFEFDRKQQPMLLYCETADGEFAGAAQVDSDTHEVEIELRPVTKIHGRLIDHETGKPMGGERLFVGIHFRSPCFGIVQTGLFSKGAVTTDEKGKFEFSGLVAGQKYDLTGVRIDKQIAERVTVSLYSLGTFITDRRASTDMGDVCRLRAQFASDALPTDRLGEAIEQAVLSRQHVLIVFSSPGDQSFRQFANLRNNDDGFRVALGGFRVVVVDPAGEHASHALALAKRLKVQLPANDQGAYFCFLDSSGKVSEGVSVTSAGDQSFPRKKLFDAAVNNSPGFPDAHELFAAALKRAGAEGKLVLLQETGPNCAPCLLMSTFLDSTRGYWSEDFVWLTLDQRWPGTLEITKRLRGNKISTIPWYAVLDSEGQMLSTSFGQDGNNRGFPGSERSREHFRQILENHSTRMTETSINEMLRELDR